MTRMAEQFAAVDDKHVPRKDLSKTRHKRDEDHVDYECEVIE